jgi:hypothetical protein
VRGQLGQLVPQQDDDGDDIIERVVGVNHEAIQDWPRKHEQDQRRSSFCWLPINEPVKTRQRSNTIAFNVPPKLDIANDGRSSTNSSTSDILFVDVRDEIMLIKDQFDKLVSVLDDDLFNNHESQSQVGTPEK